MNIFCYVTDAKIAESLIVRELESRGFLEGSVIAQLNGDTVEVLWRRNFEGAFSLI
jgi:hypothetical protein